MKSKPTWQQLEAVLEPVFQEVESNSIIQHQDGYTIFGVYDVRRQNGIWTVSKFTSEPLEFSSSKTALSWCIADKYQQIGLSNDIYRLDRYRHQLSNNIAVRTKLRDKISSTQMKDIIAIKLSSRQARLAQVESSLDKCINLAKYWQIRGFNNETARTRRTASNRTSC